MYQNRVNIERLRQVIYDALDNLITDNYCLLDVPNHRNIGDNLIWAGELVYLKRRQYKMLYSASHQFCQFSKIPKDSLLLLHGGGNFGDIWRLAQEFRNVVIKNCRSNKIIIFPQTVYYCDKKLLEKDAAIFASHPDITICARDIQSYAFFQQYFGTNKILLVPDMAFCLDFDRQISDEKTNKILIMKRYDKEFNANLDPYKLNLFNSENKDRIQVKDWPTYNLDKQHERMYNIKGTIQTRIAEKMIHFPLLNKMVDHRYGLKNRSNLTRYIQMGVEFINKYDEIYTTRLHGCILAILLNKKVHIIDNSYGKNKNFFNTWLKDFQQTHLIADT